MPMLSVFPLLLRCASFSPIQVSTEPHLSCQPLAPREKASIGTVLEVGTDVDECKTSGYPGGELRKARSSWLGKQLHPEATMKLPNVTVIVTYVVRSGKLYRKELLQKDHVERDDEVFIESLLLRTLRRFPQAPDADILLSYGDTESPESKNVQAPVFTFSPLRHGDGAIGFPNPYLIDEALDMKARKVLNGSPVKHVPWKKKAPQVYWRGALTGSTEIENTSIALNQSRVRLAHIAAAHPKDINFAFTKFDLQASWGIHVQSLMQRIFDRSPRSEQVVFHETLPQYKYLLNVDGVTVAWRGLSILASGSVALLAIGARGEFFYRDLEPWVHYIPVKEDMTDLIVILSFLREHDSVAHRIGMRGRQFALANLSIASLECYCLDVLRFMSEVAAPVPLHELQNLYNVEPVVLGQPSSCTQKQQ